MTIILCAICFLAGNGTYAALDWWAERSVMRRNRYDLSLAIRNRK